MKKRKWKLVPVKLCSTCGKETKTLVDDMCGSCYGGYTDYLDQVNKEVADEQTNANG